MNLSQQLQQKIDLKTKPLGALGFVETLAHKIGMIQQSLSPKLLLPHMVVFAADHGLASEGVSAYPQDVTYQMVLNFLNQGASINVFCKQHNIQLQIVDAGVKQDFEPHPLLKVLKTRNCSGNVLNEDAMTSSEFDFCIESGASIVEDIARKGSNVIGFGEMGIGNTSIASLLMSKLTNIPIEDCVGRGTGVNDEQLVHKIEVLSKAINRVEGIIDIKDVLAAIGGLEIAQMVGAMLAAKKHNMIILIDGFIATVALLAAMNIDATVKENAIFTHISNEKAHKMLLDYLGQRAILQLDMRVGEGIGCAVAYPILESAVRFLNEMASFESAGVSNK